MTTTPSKTFWVPALILSIGLIIAAALMAFSFKYLNRNTGAITVKGLAEKPIQADSALWEINLQTSSASETKKDAYVLLDQQMKVLRQFFLDQGFSAQDFKMGNKSSESYYEEVDIGDGRLMRQFKGYIANQKLAVSSRDIAKIEKAAKAIYILDEQNISINESPNYLVSNLEDIKMSLIANATKNAFSRANEFAKVGEVKVGAMRSASQGAFYILPDNGSDENSDYGGAYDKTTINKIARVVVTINYSID